MPPKKGAQPQAVPTRKSSRLNTEGKESNTVGQSSSDTTDKTENIIERIERDDTSASDPEAKSDTEDEPNPADIPVPVSDSDNDDDTMSAAAKAELDELRKRLASLEAVHGVGENRGARGVTPAASAFGGTEFKPTGFAALPAFTPWGDDQDAANPKYDKKAKKTAVNPGVFTGDKAEFDKWVIKVHDQFDEDSETFKKERSRMAVINALTQGPANDLLEARYRSTKIPFKSAAEMIATLTAVYHDDNQGTNAREELRNLMYSFRSMDIHQFIGKVNSLADKANISQDERKTVLYEHIPAGMNPQLLGDSKDPLISYENFANKVADSALAQVRAWKERKQGREKFANLKDKDVAPKEVVRPVKPNDKTVKFNLPIDDKDRKNGRCFLCHKEGHIARECPDKAAQIQALLRECESDDESSDESSQSSNSEKLEGPPEVSAAVHVPQVVAQVRNQNANTFHLPVMIQIGERALRTNALLDTGAQIRLSISPTFARIAIDSLGAKLQKTKRPIQLTDYRKRPTEKATKQLVASFEINGIRFSNEKFLVIETGYDIFIGQDWFIEKDVWLHPRTKAIDWPDDLSARRTAEFSPPIIVNRAPKNRTIDKDAQDDVERRDKLMEQEQQYTILQNPDRQISAVVPEEKPISIARLMAEVLSDPRQKRWKKLKMPKEPIPLVDIDRSTANIAAVATDPSWKTYDGQPIPFPDNEDPEHVKKVRETLPPALVVPKGADLVDLIIKENKAQSLGKHDTRLIVPETTTDGKIYLRTALIVEAHVPQIFAHGGEKKTIRRIQRDYYWDHMTKDIKRYIRNCRPCKWNNGRRDKIPGLLHPLPIPNRVWEQVVVDGKDMPKDEYGYDYVWVFICKFSRLMATLPGKKNDTAEKVATRYYRYLYRFLGVPDVWINDNAGPFISGFLQTVNELTGTKHRHGSSLHPQTQGAVEITNAELDQRLRFYIDKYQTQWSKHLPALDFSHNTSYHSSIEMAPLKVALGSDPRDPLSLPLEKTPISDKNQKAALELVQQTKTVQDYAKECARRAQAAQEIQANKKRRPVDFGVGDMVYVDKKGFTTEAPTTRLDSKNAGPWLILGRKGHSYVLETPSWFKGSSVFHADRLRKAADDPLPQQHVEPEEPEEIDGEPEWEVDEILASRINGRTKALEYQVSWRGCDPVETWYRAENFKNAATALEKFHNKYPDCAGPPVRLQHWIRAAANDEDAGHHVDDNTAKNEPTGLRAKKRHPTRHK